MFDVLWCLQTTFRAFSVGLFWPINITAILLLMLPWMLTTKRWLQYTVMGIVDLIMISNLMYCRTYFTSIPLTSYGLAGNLKDFLPSVTDSFSPLFLLLPLITLATWWWARRAGKQHKSSSKGWAAWSIMFYPAVIITFAIMSGGGGFNKTYTTMKEACYYSTCTTPVYTIAGDYIWQLTNKSDTITAAENALVENWISEHDKQYAPAPLKDSTSVKDNLVMIICESLESWPINAKAEGKTKGSMVEITPYLNSLIADSTSLYAPQVVTQVGSGRSIDFQLLFTAGLLPMESGVWSMSKPDNSYPSLNRALALRNGARSYILSPDSPTTWNQALAAKSLGIDTLLSRDSWKLDELVGKPAKLSDGSFFKQITEKMQGGELWKVGDKAFIQVITYSGHNPFRLPEKLRTVQFSDKYPERLRDYMQTAHYTDAAIKGFVEYLKTRPDFDRTLIVITGDHEGLAASRNELHTAAPQLVSDKQMTPLIVVNSPVKGKINYPIGQADLYPTMLQMLGLTDYKWKGVGISAFHPRHPRYATVTMTGEIIGDTISVDANTRDMLKRGRRVSDLIIRHLRK